MTAQKFSPLAVFVRHEGEAPRERSTCGWRDRLISREDSNTAAWAHAVDMDGGQAHFHKRATELYYVLEGEGGVVLDGVEHPVRKGSIVHIPPGVVHASKGRMRVLVVGIPDISDDDLFFPDPEEV
jgi:mannose-6-phosphate isomerase-like protein (cupin superfamily)